MRALSADWQAASTEVRVRVAGLQLLHVLTEDRAIQSHPEGALRPAENDREVVRGHIDYAIKHEAMIAGASRHFVQIAQPPARITTAQVFIERGVAGFDRPGSPAKRPVQIERSTCIENPAGASHQAFGRGPWADVDHIDANHGRGMIDRPVVAGGIEIERRTDTLHSLCHDPGVDRAAGFLGWV